MNAPVRDERLPRTVSACHAMIHDLRKKLSDAANVDELRQQIEEKDGEIESLGGKLSEAEAEVDRLEALVEERADPIDAINHFLDEVERPVGKLTFDVVHGPAADRAILALFDAAGRQI
jgi:predicted nuclease with TOPRIM domain